jgi:hypothetical protein
VILTAIDSAKAYPDSLRRVSYLDIETQVLDQIAVDSRFVQIAPSRGLERCGTHQALG